MARAAGDYKKRQAAYAGKNRQKEKALRRPTARAIADAYMVVVEGGLLKRNTEVLLKIVKPDDDIAVVSRTLHDLIRNSVRGHLIFEGYDAAQVDDKLASMFPSPGDIA